MDSFSMFLQELAEEQISGYLCLESIFYKTNYASSASKMSKQYDFLDILFLCRKRTPINMMALNGGYTSTG